MDKKGMDFYKKESIAFGERLRIARDASKVTQAELGGAIGVSQQTIASWESGRTEPNIYLLKLLADFFLVSVNSLLNSDADSIKREVCEALPILESPQNEFIQNDTTNETNHQSKLEDVLYKIEENAKKMSAEQLERMLLILKLTFEDFNW